MKTIISIPIIILILFSGINVKFATHYCGGSVAATKISLTGELATCGMEHSSVRNSLNVVYSTKCCDDVLSDYSICNNYFPASYSINDPYQQVISVLIIPADFQNNQELTDNTTITNRRPPGPNSPNSVSLTSLCIFRI
jgi:hypothetical protein